MRVHIPIPAAAAVAAALLLAACGTDSTPARTGVEVETIGDTTVVRTLSGSVWGAEATLVPEVTIGRLDGPEEYLFGSIYNVAVDDDGRVYVLDGQVQHVRVFDSEGTHLETMSRRGQGPGELNNAMSVAALPDGRVVAHDLGDMMIKVVGPGDAERDHWASPAGGVVLPVKPLRIDRNGRILVMSAGTAASGDLVEYVRVMAPGGELLDSLSPPGVGFEPPSLEVRLSIPIGGRSTFPYAIPFTARHYWTVHPNGRFATGISSDYRVDLQTDDGVLRIERAWEPVPISESERGYHVESTTAALRTSQPNWSWNGPPIPETKRPFRGLVAGRDGRIWVQLWTEARPVVNEDHDPNNPRSQPVSWVSPVRYDAFEPDGTYLGALATPDGFLASPAVPVFDGDHVWAVTRDELEVQRVVRYRIVVGGSGS